MRKIKISANNAVEEVVEGSQYIRKKMVGELIYSENQATGSTAQPSDPGKFGARVRNEKFKHSQSLNKADSSSASETEENEENPPVVTANNTSAKPNTRPGKSTTEPWRTLVLHLIDAVSR
ncbi:hypothetical protein FBU30_000885 [Linnemannia zychae]|nr:hypothetical protein FBU30_000885 [Linnemannia zychae]